MITNDFLKTFFVYLKAFISGIEGTFNVGATATNILSKINGEQQLPLSTTTKNILLGKIKIALSVDGMLDADEFLKGIEASTTLHYVNRDSVIRHLKRCNEKFTQ